EKLRQQQAEAIPAIFHYDAGASDEVESRLRAAFATAREKFLNALEANYARRQLNEVAITYPRFQRLVVSFQREFSALPVNTNLTALWALGASDQAVQTNLAAKLREMMARHIVADSLPAEATIGPEEVRLISSKATDAAVDLALVEKEATNFFKTNMCLL